jgi:hypothetical protein
VWRKPEKQTLRAWLEGPTGTPPIEVWIDNGFAGISTEELPLDRELRPGEHEIRIRQEGTDCEVPLSIALKAGEARWIERGCENGVKVSGQRRTAEHAPAADGWRRTLRRHDVVRLELQEIGEWIKMNVESWSRLSPYFGPRGEVVEDMRSCGLLYGHNSSSSLSSLASLTATPELSI